MNNEPIGTIAAYAGDYKPAAREAYTLAELGWWVHLFAKRAEHPDTPEKREKDLYDASTYLDMMKAKLDALEAKLDALASAK